MFELIFWLFNCSIEQICGLLYTPLNWVNNLMNVLCTPHTSPRSLFLCLSVLTNTHLSFPLRSIARKHTHTHRGPIELELKHSIQLIISILKLRWRGTKSLFAVNIIQEPHKFSFRLLFRSIRFELGICCRLSQVKRVTENNKIMNINKIKGKMFHPVDWCRLW